MENWGQNNWITYRIIKNKNDIPSPVPNGSIQLYIIYLFIL